MGFKYVEAALQAAIPKTEGIDTGVVKAVLVAICQHADNTTGQCFPAIDRLARMCQHSQSSVSRAVDALQKLKVFTHYRQGDGHICSRYCVSIKVLQGWAIDWQALRARPEDVGTLGSQQDGRVPTGMAGAPAGAQGSQQAPNLSLNRSLNQSQVQSEKHSLAALAPPSAGCLTSKPRVDQKQVKTGTGSVGKARATATPGQPKHAPCARCKGPTYGSPTLERGLAFCQDCMKVPSFSRHNDGLELQWEDPSKPYYVEPL